MGKEQVLEQAKQEFTKNEDGTVTVVLSADTVAKLEALEEFARNNHPLFSIVADLEKAFSISGEAPSEVLEMIADMKKEFKENINYAGLVGAAIEATYHGMKSREEQGDLPDEMKALLKMAEGLGAETHVVRVGVGGGMSGGLAGLARRMRDMPGGLKQ